MEEIKVKIPLRKLRKIRKSLCITQSMIAEYLGVSTQFFSQMERGVNVLNYENALKIAKYLKTTPDELFRDDFIQAQRFHSRNKKEG